MSWLIHKGEAFVIPRWYAPEGWWDQTTPYRNAAIRFESREEAECQLVMLVMSGWAEGQPCGVTEDEE